MSESFTEALGSEAWGGEGIGSESEAAGDAFESEAYLTEGGWPEGYGEDARRRQRIVVARRQAQRSRPPARPPTPTPPRMVTAGPSASQAAQAATQAVRAVSDDVTALDQNTRAALRNLHRELEKAKRHADEAAYATAATTIFNQGLDTFQDTLGNHPLVRAVARAAPLGLLYSYGPRHGAGKFFGNPIFIGIAGVALVLAGGQIVSASEGTTSVSVTGANTVSKRIGSAKLTATALTRNGSEVDKASFDWKTDDGTIAQVDPYGNVTPAPGAMVGQATWVTATSGGVIGRLWMTINE